MSDFSYTITYTTLYISRFAPKIPLLYTTYCPAIVLNFHFKEGYKRMDQWKDGSFYVLT